MTTDTEPIWLLDLRPSVPTRYVRRSVLRSPFARHLRAATQAAFWPAVIGAGLILAFTIIAHLQAIAPSVPIR